VNITVTITAVIDITTLCTPSLAVTHTAAHEFPRVRSASPCPSGPGIITRGDLVSGLFSRWVLAKLRPVGAPAQGRSSRGKAGQRCQARSIADRS
jgi:hypothetical protein